MESRNEKIRVFALLAGADEADARDAESVFDYLSREDISWEEAQETEKLINARIGKVLAAALAYMSGFQGSNKASDEKARWEYCYKAMEIMQDVAEETDSIEIEVVTREN